MKPFKLESVLNYRRRLEDNARKNLTEVLREETALKKKKKELETELGMLYSNITRTRETGVTVDQLILSDLRITAVRERMEDLARELEKAGEKVKRRRNGLLKAGQDRQALEKLKEKQNKGYRDYLNKKEAVMLDEIAILFHDRQQ